MLPSDSEILNETYCTIFVIFPISVILIPECSITLLFYVWFGVWQRVATGHGLPKVSPGPAKPHPSTPSTTHGWPTAVLYPFGHPMPYAYNLHSPFLQAQTSASSFIPLIRSKVRVKSSRSTNKLRTDFLHLAGHRKSHEVTGSHTKSHEVTRSHTKSHEVTRSHTKSHEVTLSPTKSHKVTEVTEVTRSHTKSVTRSHTKRHEVTRSLQN
jgi:hypothetical protein